MALAWFLTQVDARAAWTVTVIVIVTVLATGGEADADAEAEAGIVVATCRMCRKCRMPHAS
ncbi:GH13955 [Drosophila grimshawi]|uniref:GH13955 n=1 Tax=Drosophila grimshawi TaxID=7222 RepID=B4K2P8_DROGR|nr:GH13955 [Drosophila grimshawi]